MIADIAIGLSSRALAALLAIAVLSGVANAAELVMFRSAGCPWCAKWDHDIGPVYPKTDIGKRLPVRMADVGDKTLKLREPIHYTPTFVLVDHGEEQGRIEGYAGDDFFWGLLERLEKKLPVPPSAVPPMGATRADAAGRVL